jgi:hypothetical protein
MSRPCTCDRCPKDGPFPVPTWRKGANGKMQPPPKDEQACFDCWRFHTQSRWRRKWSGEKIPAPKLKKAAVGQDCCGGKTPYKIDLSPQEPPG